MKNQRRINGGFSFVLVFMVVFGVLAISGGKVLANTSSTPELHYANADEIIPDIIEEIAVAYTITATPNNSLYGTVTGEGNYPADSSVTLNAIPNAGYRFVRWMEAETEVTASIEYIFTATGSRTLIAEFAPLDIPTGIAAVSNQFNSIDITWTASPEATGYKVFRSTTAGGSYTTIKDTTAIGYTDTNLATGTKYFYKVKAYATVEGIKYFSGFSEEVNAAPTLSAPTNPQAAIAGYNSISINWTAVPGATGYKILRSISSAGIYTGVTDTTAINYTDTGLATGTRYFYKIRAYTMVGTTKIFSPDSSYVYAKPFLSVPTNPLAKATSYNSIQISWKAVPGAAGYKILRSTSSAGTYLSIKDTTALSYTNGGLTTGTRYFYKIKAYIMVGTTKVFSTDSKYVYAKPILNVPTGLKAAVASSNSTKLSWAAVSGATGYKIYRSDSIGGTYAQIKDTTSLSYVNTATLFDTTYYKVVAYVTINDIKIFSTMTAAVHVTTEMIYQKGISYFNAGNFTDCSKTLAGIVGFYDYYSFAESTLTTYKDAAKYFILSTIISTSDHYTDGNIYDSWNLYDIKMLYESGKTYADFKNMQDYLDHPIFTGPRLVGSWSGYLQSVYYYFELIVNEDGSSQLFYNLPDFPGDYYRFVQNGAICQIQNIDSGSWKNTFKLTLLSDTQLQIYSYQDGRTYTLSLD